MNIYELRVYTLASAEAANAYLKIWIKHIESLKSFGIVTHGVFTIVSEPTKVVALVNYSDGITPEDATNRFMSSDLFKADMAGFDIALFSSVETTLLNPATFSSLQ